MTKFKKKVFIVSHTHWDREWYLPFHEFRMALNDTILKIFEQLENNSEFKHFVLDGQAVVLEDYLEMFPNDKKRIKKLVSENKLSIGPWYILPDEFLVSGESTIRNILIGHQVCNKFGAAQKVGYLPDTFGHIAQMPQILKLAGIDSFIYSRGNGNEIDDLGCEYFWQAPDGSEVLAIHQVNSYCNAGGLGFDNILDAQTKAKVDLEKATGKIKILLDKYRGMSNCNVYLFNNGCDHLPPQQNFSGIINKLKKEFPDTEFVHSSFSEYIKELKSVDFQKKSYTGDLLSGKLQPILTGVWSSRMNLKILNNECQTILEKYVEPLSSYFHFVLGNRYPQEELKYAWKLLLKNHPHDSICGCSVDEVHREMITRFENVKQLTKKILKDEINIISPNFLENGANDQAISVINTLPEKRSEIVERLIVIPLGSDIINFELADNNGNNVSHKILVNYKSKNMGSFNPSVFVFSNQQISKFKKYLSVYKKRQNFVGDKLQNQKYFIIQFLAEDIPALGYKNYHFKFSNGKQNIAKIPSINLVKDNVIENNYYKIIVKNNGAFDLLNKIDGKEYFGLNRLEDTEDIGDEYDHSYSKISKSVFSDTANGKIKVIENNEISGKIEVEYKLFLPQKINNNRISRSKKLVGCNVKTIIGLKKDSKIIEVKTKFVNKAKDHRLRVHFPTNLKSNKIITDNQFVITERKIKQSSGKDWVQEPVGTFPQQDFSLIQSKDRGFAVLNKGLPEIAAIKNNGKITLALTLFRAVEWLSRSDLANRQAAGPSIYTPEAQLLQELEFEYGLVPFSGNYIQSKIKSLSQRYKMPLLVKQGFDSGNKNEGISFLQKTTNLTAISAIKKCENTNNLLIRIYNLTKDQVNETLILGKEIEAVWKTNILEKRIEKLIVIKNKLNIKLKLKPYEIMNLEVGFKKIK